MKDVLLPRQMQRAMASEAEADRDARAKVINMITMMSSGTFFVKVVAAEGEKKASQALREAADTISESPAALQLRYLQVQTEPTTESDLPPSRLSIQYRQRRIPPSYSPFLLI